MKRLILTNDHGLDKIEFSEVSIPFVFRFVSAPLPSPDQLSLYLAARSGAQAPGGHWSDHVGRWRNDSKSRRDLGLIEFCQTYDGIELWFDGEPNSQLQLIWLLDCLKSCPAIVAKSRLRLLDFDLVHFDVAKFADRYIPDIGVTTAELETASIAWQAYRATTPEACFNLLRSDLSPLPLLMPAMVELLEELPFGSTGLGATEMRLLELIANGYDRTNALFYLKGLRQRRVYAEFEMGTLLEGLALGPKPAVAGLDDALRTIARTNLRARDEAYKRSRLSITEFGRLVLAHKEDFSRHNPVDRCWGGTRLTNDNLWRWDPVLTAPGKR